MNIAHFLNIAQNDLTEKEKVQEIIKETNETKLRDIKNTDLNKNKTERIQFKIDTKNEEEDRRIGEKLIEDFKKLFKKSKEHNDIKLSNNKNMFELVEVTKKVFEEIIIFFLICTSIAKMSVWSFVYMIISLILSLFLYIK